MELELHPAVSLKPRSFNILITSERMLVEALRNQPVLGRYKVLYIAGNYSRILNRIERKFAELEIRRAFTAFQLLTILEEACHTLVLIEHDPSLYEDSSEILGYISFAMKEASNSATVLLYSPKLDPTIETISDMADRVFYFRNEASGERRSAQSRYKPSPDLQRTLGAF
jgi:DNA polymerase I